MNKKSKKTAAISAKARDLIATAATLGYAVQGGYAAAVNAVKQLGDKSKAALTDFGLEYKAGYIARYLEDEKAMKARWGNLTQQQRMTESALIYAKPSAESAKPNRRTALEHSACRAADVSWFKVRSRAGLVKKTVRKPRPASNKPSKAVPVDLVKASPKLATKGAANDYFATAAAALLATVNRNAKVLDPRLSTAVSDFRTAVNAALGITAE